MDFYACIDDEYKLREENETLLLEDVMSYTQALDHIYAPGEYARIKARIGGLRVSVAYAIAGSLFAAVIAMLVGSGFGEKPIISALIFGLCGFVLAFILGMIGRAIYFRGIDRSTPGKLSLYDEIQQKLVSLHIRIADLAAARTGSRRDKLFVKLCISGGIGVRYLEPFLQIDGTRANISEGTSVTELEKYPAFITAGYSGSAGRGNRSLDFSGESDELIINGGENGAFVICEIELTVGASGRSVMHLCRLRETSADEFNRLILSTALPNSEPQLY